MLPELPSIALSARRLRPDLQAAFDITTAKGREGLFWWLFCRGRREIPLKLDMDGSSTEFVNEPQENIKKLSFLPITRLMWQLWRQSSSRPGNPIKRKRFWDFVTRLTPSSYAKRKERDDQEAVLAWYFMHEIVDSNLEQLLTSEQAQKLLETNSTGLTRFERLIWKYGADVSQRFASDEDPEFRLWIRREASREFRLLSHAKIRLAEEMRDAARPLSNGRRPYGVNLYGHAGARLGVGEDVRMAALALNAAGVPFTLHSVNAGDLPDEEPVNSAADTVDYAFNLFCMSGQETFSLAQRRGRALLDGRYNIGFWPWELPRWPALLEGCFELVDEVWTSSRFTALSLQGSAPVPVRHLPMVVVADGTEGLLRTDFGLPEERFLFGFAFDGNSGFERKNPLACVRAFQVAFPIDDNEVGLVIKAIRVGGLPGWAEIERAAARDPRIHLLTGSYSRARLLDLYRNLDAFVSLHRSEGFGRNIAEAMLLFKPVIATEYSGNLDFTTQNTAILIDATETDLSIEDYGFGEGMKWRDPDVGQASRAMIRLKNDRSLQSTLARNGHQSISTMFDTLTVGRKYRLILDQIYGRDSGD